MVTQLFPTPNITQPQNLFAYSNTVTNNLFGPLTLVAMFIVIFISQKSTTTEKAFASTSFIMLPITALFGILNFIYPPLVVIPAIFATISILVLVGRRDGID